MMSLSNGYEFTPVFNQFTAVHYPIVDLDVVNGRVIATYADGTVLDAGSAEDYPVIVDLSGYSSASVSGTTLILT